MNLKTLFSEFAHSLKNPRAEELVDLAVYRPLAFFFVKCTFRLPLTPNRVSLMAMAAGIAAGCCFAGGRPHDFVQGGLLFALSNVLDCADGMIARLRHNGTKTGRIVDGLVDYVAGGAAYLGFGIGLARTADFPVISLALLGCAVASTILHSIKSDFFRNAFVRQGAGKTDEDNEVRIFSGELDRLNRKPGDFFDKTLIRIYLRYLVLQSGKKHPQATLQPPVGPTGMVLWNLIGPSTHITFFVLAAMLNRPEVFFFFSIVAANLWMLMLSLARKSRYPATP